jgi:hypothetical protein
MDGMCQKGQQQESSCGSIAKGRNVMGNIYAKTRPYLGTTFCLPEDISYLSRGAEEWGGGEEDVFYCPLLFIK